MGYKQGVNGTIIRDDDGAIIPRDPKNCDYQAYLAWKAGGNTLTPAPGPTLAQAQAAQIAAISGACQAQILNGFNSSALGSLRAYPSSDIDQRNLLSAVTDAQGQGASWVTSLWCAAGSPPMWSFASHTAAQVQQVNADWLSFRVATQQKYANLVAQINAATTPAAVEEISW